MLCVTSITYSVILNGHARWKFQPSRGIRKDDPISPYLFLLCVEGLSTLLDRAKQQGDIQGIKVARGYQPINQFFFYEW